MKIRLAGVAPFHADSWTDGRMDMTAPVVVFRNCFANAPPKVKASR